MALTNNGTKVSVNSSKLPTGYTKPTITEFSDNEGKYEQTLTVAKSTVENATATTTMAAIVTAVNTAIGVQVTADFDVATNDVTIYSDITAITTNNNLSGVLFTNGTLNYLVTVVTYFKTETA
jgi:hypothetical protein